MYLKDIPQGATFVMPWRPAGIRAGKVRAVRSGSVHVHMPRHEGDGWEEISLSPHTQVEPCDPLEYSSQRFGKKGGSSRMENRSTVKKPVDLVWDLCDEIIGRGNAPTVEDRDRMVAAAVEQGVNPNTAKTQYYQWRKKHGA